MTTQSHCNPGTARLSVQALQSPFAGPFSFELQAGECIAIQGPSGAGKSVLLRMLADLDPHSGEIFLDGRSYRSMPAPAWRSKVVYHAAETAWWDATAELHFAAEHRDWARATLPALGLGSHVLQTEIERLSTGERQRLALLRSLACRPDVLLLDEPTASLDPASIGRTEELLQTFLARGMSLLIVTHSAEQAQRMAQRFLHIDHGKLIPA